MTQAVFRFAPSPNGRLHLGHAYSALLNQKLAREAGGILLLRIENTDRLRCTPALEAHMLEDLRWLGIAWEGEPRRQSAHSADYEEAVKRLEAMGLAYPAFLSRGEARRLVEDKTAAGGSLPRAWPCDPDGVPHYPGDDRSFGQEERARRIGRGDPYAMRFDMARAMGASDAVRERLCWREEGGGPDGERGDIVADPAAWGDFMLTGRDRSAAYHLACVVDDAIQGITHVVRGRDLYHATSAHRLLQELLGLPAPVYRHHDLILDGDGRKLSKSDADTSLGEMRAAGATPQDIVRMVGL